MHLNLNDEWTWAKRRKGEAVHREAAVCVKCEAAGGLVSLEDGKQSVS